MGFEVAYWHWIAFGLILVLSEIFIGSFFVIWFGAAAVAVGILAFVIPSFSLAVQTLIWAILSVLFAWGWFKFLKPLSVDKTKAGLSREALIGQIGQVLSPPNGDHRGKLRFPAPLLGSDEWLIISQDKLAIGDRVSVKDLSGNSLIVEKA